MSKSKTIRTIFTGTILSILIFLSICFITFLTQINPLHYYTSSETYKLNIGFPFIYYTQFWISGSTIPNSGWTTDNLFYDGLITWIAVNGFLFLIRRKKNNSH